MCPCLHPRKSALLLGCRLGLLLPCGRFFFCRTRSGEDVQETLSIDDTEQTHADTSTLRLLRRSYLEWMPNANQDWYCTPFFAFATCLHNLSDLLVYVSVKLYIVSIVYHTYLRILYVCPVLYERLSIDHSVTPTRLSHIFLIGWVGKWVIAAAMELEDKLEAVKWWWIRDNMMI